MYSLTWLHTRCGSHFRRIQLSVRLPQGPKPRKL